MTTMRDFFCFYIGGRLYHPFGMTIQHYIKIHRPGRAEYIELASFIWRHEQ